MKNRRHRSVIKILGGAGLATLMGSSGPVLAQQSGMLQVMMVPGAEGGSAAPEITLSIRGVKPGGVALRNADYGPSFVLGAPHAIPLAPGDYELGVQVPDGYAAAASICANCATHPAQNLVAAGGDAGPLMIHMPGTGAVDVQIRLTPLAPGPAGGPAVRQMLTCNLSGMPDPTPATDTLLFKGSQAWAEVGINRAIGGIGVSLKLINPQAPRAPLQIIEARSSGGAAWQTSFDVADEAAQRIWNFNQAAGNSAEVWGFGDDYQTGPKIGFVQKHWSPIFSNDYHVAISSSAASINTTPCYGTGRRLGDGQLRLTPELIPAGGGELIRLHDDYALRFAGDQHWKWFMADQALYLNLAAAHAGNLRVYLAMPATGAGPGTVIGPVIAYKSFGNFPRAHLHNIVCDEKNCLLASEPIAYAVLVWTVQGKDIAIAIHPRDPAQLFYGYLQLRNDTLCKGGDRCGNVQFHARLADSRADPSAPDRFSAGEVEHYEAVYEIGTLEQLAAIGFAVPRPDVKG